jgi:hypothetical protein
MNAHKDIGLVSLISLALVVIVVLFGLVISGVLPTVFIPIVVIVVISILGVRGVLLITRPEETKTFERRHRTIGLLLSQGVFHKTRSGAIRQVISLVLLIGILIYVIIQLSTR